MNRSWSPPPAVSEAMIDSYVQEAKFARRDKFVLAALQRLAARPVSWDVALDAVALADAVIARMEET